MITADQLFVHAVGDYLLQSDWMANEKTRHWLPAWTHALVYSAPFLVFSPSGLAWLTIFGTHFLIDRYRLARYVVWLKNLLGPYVPWEHCRVTGYPDGRPLWLAVWLMIIVDNLCHVGINALALKYL